MLVEHRPPTEQETPGHSRWPSFRHQHADPALPRGVRIRLWLLLAYLLTSVDLVPDFIPIIGYADDAIIVVIALRSVIHHAGHHAIERHWPGTSDALTAIQRLAGTTSSKTS